MQQTFSTIARMHTCVKLFEIDGHERQFYLK